MSDVHGRVIVIRLSLEVTHIGTVLWLGYGQVIPATWGGGFARPLFNSKFTGTVGPWWR